jgi:hypothetical protein
MVGIKMQVFTSTFENLITIRLETVRGNTKCVKTIFFPAKIGTGVFQM